MLRSSQAGSFNIDLAGRLQKWIAKVRAVPGTRFLFFQPAGELCPRTLYAAPPAMIPSVSLHVDVGAWPRAEARLEMSLYTRRSSAALPRRCLRYGMVCGECEEGY
jgi:hypothetical protein